MIKNFIFHDYDFLILFGVAVVVLITMDRVIGDRQVPTMYTHINVAYDKDTKPEEVDRMCQQARGRAHKNLAERGISVVPAFRSLGVEGYDIVWGDEPQANHPGNTRIRFAVIWMPLIIAGIVVLLLAGYRGWKGRRTIAIQPMPLVGS